MSQDNMHRLHRAKLGPKSTAGGDETVTSLAQALSTSLQPGWHVIVCTTDTYMVQCKDVATAQALSAGTIAAIGRKLVAGDDYTFHVGALGLDGALAWVRVSADGTFRINRTDMTQGE